MHLFLKKIYRKNPFPKIYRINQCEVLNIVTGENNRQENKTIETQLYIEKQTRGSNIVINPKVEVPEPIIKIKSWSAKNKKVTSFSESFFFIYITDKELNEEFYLNTIEISYESEVSLNKIQFFIKRTDILALSEIHNGLSAHAYKRTKEGFLYQLNKPEDGIYIFKVYTKKKMKNPLLEIDINY